MYILRVRGEQRPLVVSAVRFTASIVGDASSVYLFFAIWLSSHLITCGEARATASSKLHESRPTVTIPQGKLRGFTMLSSKNRTIYAFLGVPYAKPPVGNLRFKPPVAPTAWKGTLDARHRKSLCFQKGSHNNIVGDDDCLYLQIFTPKLPSRKNATLLPVMLYVIGGGFNKEDSTPSRHSPGFLLNRDMLFVVPTFRVGVLGFLSTGDEVAPGNYGLKDIVRALEWTQENIKHFGGDPDQVTLAGGSSGAVSISLLSLTDATNGLYHKYITHSGFALAPSLQRPKESHANDANMLGKYLGCPTDTSELLVDCLRGLTGSQLVQTDSLFRVWKSWPLYNWGPTVEPDIEGALITRIPASLVAEGKGQTLPWLTSTVRDEGFGVVKDFVRHPSLFEEFLENIDCALPLLLDYVYSSSNVTAFTEALKSYYLPDLSADRSSLIKNLTQLAGDVIYWYPMYGMLQQRISDGTCSQYECSLEYILQGSDIEVGGLIDLIGVWHGDENLFLFGDLDHISTPPWYRYSEDDFTIVEEIVKMWTSFMINGEPTPVDVNGRILWEPYSSRQNYLQIGDGYSPGLYVKYGLHKKRMEFLDELMAAVPWIGMTVEPESERHP